MCSYIYGFAGLIWYDFMKYTIVNIQKWWSQLHNRVTKWKDLKCVSDKCWSLHQQKLTKDGKNNNCMHDLTSISKWNMRTENLSTRGQCKRLGRGGEGDNSRGSAKCDSDFRLQTAMFLQKCSAKNGSYSMCIP